MTEPLSELICGNTTGNSEIDQILKHIKQSIKKIVIEIKSISSESDEKLTLYGPYLGRSLLELASTAFITKLDPLRALIVKANQLRTDYEIGKPNKASIRWQGDILTEAISDLWADKYLDKPTRAVFGAYNVQLVLNKSAQNLLDSIAEDAVGGWYQQLTQQDGEGLISRLRNEITTLYSKLSKGIHHEFVMPIESMLDRDTVISSLNEAIYLVASLGLIVSTIPHAYGNAPQATNLELYKSLQV